MGPAPASSVPQGGLLDRNVSPPHDLEVLGQHGFVQRGAAPLGGLPVEEGHGDAGSLVGTQESQGER